MRRMFCGNSVLVVMFIICVFLCGAEEVKKVYKNVCLEEITNLANNSLAWRLVHLYGDKLTTKRKLSHDFMQQLRKESLSDKPFVEIYDNSFIEASWCHRNAQWATYVFIGDEIMNPEPNSKTLGQPKHVLLDIKGDVTNGITNGLYLITVPRFLKEDDTPKNFFYRTHWFVIQVVKECEIESPCFRIYAGFARHYRMIDYLTKWDIQYNIPDEHPLKIDHSVYAGVDMSMESLMRFMFKLSHMMEEINFSLKWNKMVNDIHKEIFFADKFRDMIEMYKLENKKNGVLERIEDFNYEEGIFDIPLLLDSAYKEYGSYHITTRKYYYKEEDCIKNSQIMRSAAYGKHNKPAKPLWFAEDYGFLDY
jgi:hypothetical protein